MAPTEASRAQAQPGLHRARAARLMGWPSAAHPSVTISEERGTPAEWYEKPAPTDSTTPRSVRRPPNLIPRSMQKDVLDAVVALHVQWLQSNGNEGRQANLEEADLRQADLRGIDLSYAMLSGANLERAELAGARLQNADLSRAKIGYANLTGCDLGGANLRMASALGANFTGAELTGALMWQIRCDYASLQSARLVKVMASNASFAHCNLSSSTLDGANLEGANLNHCNLNSASMIDTRLDGVSLVGTLFSLKQGQVLADLQMVGVQSNNTENVELQQMERARRLTLGANKKLLSLTLTMQKAALIVAAIAVGLCLLAGAFDLYEVVRTRSTSSATGFNYLAALLVGAIGIAMAVGAALLRFKIYDRSLVKPVPQP